MTLIKREWTPREADEWKKEDTLAVVISPLIYVLLTIGPVLSLLLIPLGFVLFGAGIVLTFLLVYIINPKLSTLSAEYEKKQKHYLEELEKKVKWEDS